jgi:hypothetical protein
MGKIFIRFNVERKSVAGPTAGGIATAAALALGVSAASASTVGHRLKHRLYDDIAEATKDLSGQAVKAIHMFHVATRTFRL